jgi:hypothetical protein
VAQQYHPLQHPQRVIGYKGMNNPGLVPRVKGVSWRKRESAWRVSIMAGGTRYYWPHLIYDHAFAARLRDFIVYLVRGPDADTVSDGKPIVEMSLGYVTSRILEQAATKNPAMWNAIQSRFQNYQTNYGFP